MATKVINIQEKQIELLNELYRSFDFFNKHFALNQLKRPLITIQTDRSHKTYGWFGKNFWGENSKKEANIDELNLTAETLHRQPEEVLETLLHEMAHLKNAQAGIKDCTVTQYHNKSFKESAEGFGLKVGTMVRKGWAYTQLDDAAKEAITQLKPNKSAYCICRKPEVRIKKAPTTIPLYVSLDYQDKIDFLLDHFDGKKEMTEAAVDLLFNNIKLKNK